MMILRVVFAAVALCASAQAAAQQQYRISTAGELAALCATPSSAADYATAVAFCHGVLAGAYGYYEASTPAEQRFVCAPQPSPKRSQIADDFVVWLKARPQLANSHPIDTLFRFAGEKFPCK